VTAALVETPRLRLREFRRDDLEALAAMVADPEQMRFYRHTRDRDEARAWLDRTLAGYAERGYGKWLIEARTAGAFLGYTGIEPLELEGVAEVEIGWHVHRSVWGQGIATEAAGAALGLALGRLGIPRVVAIVPPAHRASRRVAEKIGMREERDVTIEELPYALYAAERPPVASGEPLGFAA